MTMLAGDVERGCALAISRHNVRVGSSSEKKAHHTNTAELGGHVENRATLEIDLMYTRSSYSDQAVYDRVETFLACIDERGKS